MHAAIAVIIGIILAIGATVVLCILVMPEKRKNGLNKFFTVIRDIFNFKTLYIEKALKVLYIFSTLACILVGFFMLFSWERYYSFYGGSYSGSWNGWIGLIIMLAGPVIVRISYEYTLLLVITASKLMSIDSKIPSNCEGKTDDTEKSAQPAPAPAPVQPAAPDPTPSWTPSQGSTPPWVHTPETAAQAVPEPEAVKAPEPEPVYRYCAYCGTKYDINKGGCPNCGK